MTRPTVNLDPIAAVLDRVLAHPLAAVARELLPETHGAIARVRDNLPAIASGIEARAVDAVVTEARELEQEFIGAMGRWVKDTIRKGKGERRAKRLGLPRAAKTSKKGKRR